MVKIKLLQSKTIATHFWIKMVMKFQAHQLMLKMVQLKSVHTQSIQQLVQVTFTPTDKSYTGKVTPVKVQAESSNGIKVDTTYTPEIVPVTPTATPAETTDIQGATQTGKP